MVICESCKAVMQEDELVRHRSWLSDYRGGTYEDYCTCPCGGDVHDAERCRICGEYMAPEELHGGCCEECLKENATVDNAIECGKEVDARTEISVNGFLASVFSQEDIDQILIAELERRIGLSRENAIRAINFAEIFCREDEGWFVDWLERRDKNNEQNGQVQ